LGAVNGAPGSRAGATAPATQADETLSAAPIARATPVHVAPLLDDAGTLLDYAARRNSRTNGVTAAEVARPQRRWRLSSTAARSPAGFGLVRGGKWVPTMFP